MNFLTLDFGNTRAHAALFRVVKGGEAEKREEGEAREVEGWFKRHGLTAGEVAAVMCQVKPHPEQLGPLLQQGLLVERVQDWWKGVKFAGMPVDYAVTLGEDRLLQAWWAFKQLPGNTLLLGAGTFLTADVVTPEGFRGGFILPGFTLTEESLGQGSQLKEAPTPEPSRGILTGEELPHTTVDALAGGMVAHVALIQRLITRWGPSQIVISGGNAPRLLNLLRKLDPSLPCQARPDLVHWALLDWYRRNIAP